MFYAQLSTINGRQICTSSVEQSMIPDQDLPWIGFLDAHLEYLNCEYKNGDFIPLTDEELKEIYNGK